MLIEVWNFSQVIVHSLADSSSDVQGCDEMKHCDVMAHGSVEKWCEGIFGQQSIWNII